MSINSPPLAHDVDGHNQTDKVKDIDPNVSQSLASDPAYSVWVGASAGTGKTRVLTDRVLRLLLPREDGAPGTPVHKILCLTFTKAGANEMIMRLTDTLGQWAIADDDALYDTLSRLLRRPVHARDIRVARSLFTHVIDVPGGLNIMTIHAFCQSVLGRFPLEAEVTPYFSVLDDLEAGHLREAAINGVLQGMMAPDSGDDLAFLARVINENQMDVLMQAIIDERHQFFRLMDRYGGLNGLYEHICASLSVDPNVTEEGVVWDACTNKNLDDSGLRKAVQILLESGSKTDRVRGGAIERWLDHDPNMRLREFCSLYMPVFLTQVGEVRKTLATKAVRDSHPHVYDCLTEEAMRLLAVQDKMKSVRCAQATRSLLSMGFKVVEAYENIKSKRLVFDYYDLILKTINLLEKPNISLWIMYKLDQGIDHVLVDEAQDTNPEQWRIIQKLSEEFFVGEGAGQNNRSVFIVGDQKQSIYSFQRASPEDFRTMRRYFREKAQEAKKLWRDVSLNISFRSVGAILSVVDSVFYDPLACRGLGGESVTHQSFRTGQGGAVVRWPVFQTEPIEDIDAWSAPLCVRDHETGAQKLAVHIADQIQGWITQKRFLHSRNRPLYAGDIMILVRTRTAFVNMLARALKTRGVPVNGLDRMVLNDEMVVQDLLALAQFVLCPADDLNLACVLKSPLIGLGEDELYDLCVDRGEEDLWSAVQGRASPEIVSYMQSLLSQSRTGDVLAFFSQIIYGPCPADSVSGLRALKSRLGEDIADPLEDFLAYAHMFSQQNAGSLQIFVHEYLKSAHVVKREMDTESGAVRIMTVHASKGLQAPVVILPDTIHNLHARGMRGRERLLWPDKTGLDVPLWSPNKSYDAGVYGAAAESIKARLSEEYNRLLYVAMTRAEDYLYVGGYQGVSQSGKSPPVDSWYGMVERGLLGMDGVEKAEDGTLIYEMPSVRGGDRAEIVTDEAYVSSPLPPWTHTPVEEDACASSKVIKPSRLWGGEPEGHDPLDGFAVTRGTIIHKLLEVLPNVPVKDRVSVVDVLLEPYASLFDAGDDIGIKDSVLGILSDSAFHDLFEENARAEVPIAGKSKAGNTIYGQIDRLLITDEVIKVVDYKSGVVPDDPHDIPDAYRLQLQTYADVLRDIYPGRTVQAALLWTDGPFLVPVLLES